MDKSGGLGGCGACLLWLVFWFLAARNVPPGWAPPQLALASHNPPVSDVHVPCLLPVHKRSRKLFRFWTFSSFFLQFLQRIISHSRNSTWMRGPRLRPELTQDQFIDFEQNGEKTIVNNLGCGAFLAFGNNGKGRNDWAYIPTSTICFIMV